jgi:uncharacterized membrane protein YfcA
MNILIYIGIGLVVGSISGALGIGGGVLLVPLLIWLCKFDTKMATGTSLAVLVPPIGLPAALEAWREQRVDLAAALWIAGAFMIGAFASSAVVDYMPDLLLRRLFGLLMLYIAIRFVLTSDSEVVNAVAGLTAVILGWSVFFLLRLLGRRHLNWPSLHEEIRRMQHEGRGDPDYYI